MWTHKTEVTKTFSNFALEFKTAREKVIDNAARLKRKKEKERAPRRIPNQNFEVSQNQKFQPVKIDKLCHYRYNVYIPRGEWK